LRVLRRALLVALLSACGRGDVEAVPNIKLGMAPRDVRERFASGEQGNWQTSFPERANDDTVLDWSSPTAHFDRARFEFHLGMLVAIRAHERDASSAEVISATPKTVTVRAPSEGGTEITVLARDCPTHHDEAESLARKAR
jgi:uncharacterized protein YcfJ